MTRGQRSRRTVIVFVSILGLIALIFVAAVLYDRYAPVSDDGDIVFFGVERDSVVGLSFDYAGAHTHLALEDGVWISEHEPDIPLDQAKVGLLLDAVSQISATRSFIPDSEDYGFDKPIRTIEILLSDGTSRVITVGSQNPQTFALYCRLDGAREIYLVASSAFSEFDANVQSLASYETIPTVLPSKILSFEIVYGAKRLVMTRGDDVLAEYDYTGARKWLARFGTDAPFAADAGGVSEYVVALTSISFEYLAVPAADARDLATYGFNQPSLTVTVVYTEDGAQKSYTLVVGSITEGGYSAVKSADSQSIYFVSTEALDTLRGLDRGILENRSACGIQKDYIESLRVEYGGASRLFTVSSKQTADDEGNVSTVYHYACAGEAVDTAEFEAFFHALLGLAYQQAADGALGNRVFSVTFKTKSPRFAAVGFALYEYDESFYASVINGEPPLLINKRYVAELLSFYEALAQ